MSTPANMSPIDVSSIVSTLMLKEQLPLDRLKHTEKKDEVQLNEYSSLKGLLQTFATSLQTLTNSFNAIGYAATSSDSSSVLAQVTGNNVAPIPHTLNVTQLAQSESQISSAVSDSSASLGYMDSLTMSIGGNSFGVNIAATDSLQNVRDNINNNAAAAQMGVTASIVSTSNGNQLILSSNQSGVANALSINDSNGDLGFTVETQAQDAQFTFDNQSATSSSNNVTSLIDGITFNLLKTTSAPVTIDISPVDPATQVANVTTAIQGVLNSYNQIMSYVDQVQANPATSNGTFPMIKLSLQEALNNTLTNAGPYHSLNDIGIVAQNSSQQSTTITTTDQNGKEVQRDIKYTTSGQLQLNTNPLLPTLSTALQNNFSAVQSLLTNSQQGLLTAASNLIDPLTGSITTSMSENVNTISQNLDMNKQSISDEEERLEQIKNQFTVKYAALNVLLEKLQATSDYMAKQLQTLNNEERWEN